MTKRLTILFVFFLLTVIFTVGFLLFKEKQREEQPSNLFSTTTTTPTATTPSTTTQTATTTTTPEVKPYQPLLVPTDDWQVYRNDRFAFVISYPPNWTIREVAKKEKYEMIKFISKAYDEQDITLMVEANPKRMKPRDFFTTDNSEPEFFLQNPEYYNGKADGKDYFVFNAIGFVPLKVAIIDAGSYFVEIDILDVQKDYKIFDSMLMSFKSLR